MAVLGWGRSGWAGQLGGLVGEVAGSVGAGVSTGVVVVGLRGAESMSQDVRKAGCDGE